MEAIGFCYFCHFFHYLLSLSFPFSFLHHFTSSLVYKVVFAFLKLPLSALSSLPVSSHLSSWLCLLDAFLLILNHESLFYLWNVKPYCWHQFLCVKIHWPPFFNFPHFCVPFSYLFVSCLRIKFMYFYSRYIVLHTKKAINICWLTVKCDHFYMQ